VEINIKENLAIHNEINQSTFKKGMVNKIFGVKNATNKYSVKRKVINYIWKNIKAVKRMSRIIKTTNRNPVNKKPLIRKLNEKNVITQNLVEKNEIKNNSVIKNTVKQNSVNINSKNFILMNKNAIKNVY
jgi:hypothetical protein